jgi:hypothetical protein
MNRSIGETRRGTIFARVVKPRVTVRENIGIGAVVIIVTVFSVRIGREYSEVIVRFSCLEEDNWQDEVDDEHGKVEQSANNAIGDAHADVHGIQVCENDESDLTPIPMPACPKICGQQFRFESGR